MIREESGTNTERRKENKNTLRLAAVFIFILCSQAVFGLLNPQSTETSLDSSTSTSTGMAVISSLVYGFVFLALLPFWRSVPSMLMQAKVMLFLPLLAIASVIWSQDPLLSFRRAFVLLTISCIGICFGSVFSDQEISRIMTATGFLLCLMCFAIFVLSPHAALDPARPGVWRGVFTQKNVLGSMMTLVFISAIHARFECWNFIRYATILMSSVLLLLSRSSTSLVALLAILAALPLWRLIEVPLKRVVVVIVPVLLLFGGLIYFAISYSSDALSLLGKDSTLTGRSELWVLVLQAIARRPILGYGYNGFWLGLKGESLNVSVAAGWIVPHAHNGVLDLLLGVGVIGTLLFFITYFRLLNMMVARLRISGATMQYLWPASFLLLLTILNVTESLLMSANSIFWLLYVTIYTVLERERHAARSVIASVNLQRFTLPSTEST